MSNVGQTIVDVVALVAAVAAAAYPPTAPFAGLIFAGGVLAGQIAFPVRLSSQGPRLGDHNTTTAELGDPIPIGWGTISVTGTVMFLDQIVEHATVETTSGGSIGGSSSVTIYTYTQSIGIGLCRGPIVDVLRVWENGELVYDKREKQSLESSADYAKRIAKSNLYSETFTLHLGDETQQPDATIEGSTQGGTGTTPPFLGLAYMVWPDRKLRDDQALRHPEFKIEVAVTSNTALDVLAPTWAQTDYHPFNQLTIAVDFNARRFFTIGDRTTGDSTPNALQGWDLNTNKQYGQITSTDLGIGDFISSIAVNPNNGNVFAMSILAGLLVKVDPASLTVIGTLAIDTSFGSWTSWGFSNSINYLGNSVDLFCYIGSSHTNTAVFIDTDSNSGAMTVDNAGLSYTDAICVTVGVNEGADNECVFWFAECSATAGSGYGVKFHKLNYTPQLNVLANSIYTSTNTGTVIPADIEALWTFCTDLTGLRYDSTDGNLIFQCTGGVGSTLAGHYYIVKANPTTGKVLWATAANIGVGLSPHDANAGIIANGKYYAPIANGYAVLDTQNLGNVTTFDLTTQLTAVGLTLTLGGAYGSTATDGVIVTTSFQGPVVIFADKPLGGQILLRDIVRDICLLSGLADDEIDVTTMDDTTIWGYSIQNTTSSARDMITPLQMAGFFDMVEHNETLRFVTRGGPPVYTLARADLGAFESDTTDDPDADNTLTGSLESSLPMQVRAKYSSYERDYQDGDQLSPARYDTDAQQIVDIQFPMFLVDDQAAQLAEINWNQAWQRINSFSAAVDMSKSFLEPTDPVLVPMGNTLVRAMITKIDDSSQILRKLTLISDDDGVYVSHAIAQPAPQQLTMVFYAASRLQLLDTPLLRDQDDTARVSAPLYMTAAPTSTDAWVGASVQESDDGGVTYTAVTNVVKAAEMGTAQSVLADANPYVTDTISTLVVLMDPNTDMPTSVSGEALDNDSTLNLAALVDANGQIEVFQFRDVTILKGFANTVQLSYFHRGKRGTDTMTGTHDVGSRFILLTVDTIVMAPRDLATLDKLERWRAVTANDTSSSSGVQTFTDLGRSLMPYAPVNLKATTTSGGTPDIHVTADRRARVGAAQWVDGETDTLPLAEDFEKYEMDIYDDSAIVRTIQSTSLPIVYANADIITDFGSIPSAITVALYQISQQVGRGFASVQTLGVN